MWSYLYNHLTRNVGVRGYDPIQGALSPLLRLGVHLSAVFIFWALLLCLWPYFNIPDACLSTSHGGNLLLLSFWQSGVAAVSTYVFALYSIHNYLPGVSDPGGPREHKIQRKPQWENKTTQLPNSSQKKWRFSVAEDSHAVTMLRMEQTSAKLTGEPSGRDIWTTQQQQRPSKETSPSKQQQQQQLQVDTDLVKEMAAGGRSWGFNPAVNPNSADMIQRAQLIRDYMASGKQPPNTKSQPTTAKEALKKAVHFYSMLQTDDGHWSGDYGGPLFLMPGFIVAWYIMGKPDKLFNQDDIECMTHYLVVHQQIDGGWGTHIESPSTMFGTTLNYVALRLMGMSMNDPVCQRGHTFMMTHGGALMTSSWAKLYLCMLGCMEWDGHNSVPPEMWLLPEWFPFHPSRMWCHARMVYLVSNRLCCYLKNKVCLVVFIIQLTLTICLTANGVCLRLSGGV